MDIYAFRAEVYVPTMPDLTGFEVEATDGHIGKIDEATMADGATCLVVDTGFWIFGKKRMLPAGVVARHRRRRAQGLRRRCRRTRSRARPTTTTRTTGATSRRTTTRSASYYDPWGGTPADGRR